MLVLWVHVVPTPALRSSCLISWIDMSFKVSYNCWTLTISCKIDFDFTEIETTIFQFVLPSDRHVVWIHHLKGVQQCQQRSHWQCSLTWCEHDTVLSPCAVEVPVSPQVTKLSHDMLPALFFGWYRTGCCDRWLAMRTCMLDILYVWLPPVYRHLHAVFNMTCPSWMIQQFWTRRSPVLSTIVTDWTISNSCWFNSTTNQL